MDILTKYELFIEFKNLKNPAHCPSGLYVYPSEINEWHCVLFIHKGYYKEGVFKFVLSIPETYPEDSPSVKFKTDMFHPLIDHSGNFSIKQQFPKWRKGKDFIVHLLHYIKNSFTEAVLTNLQEQFCLNRDAFKMLLTERGTFAKLSSQCAQLSSESDALFDNELFPDFDIQFTNVSDQQAEEIKSKVLATSYYK